MKPLKFAVLTLMLLPLMAVADPTEEAGSVPIPTAEEAEIAPAAEPAVEPAPVPKMVPAFVPALPVVTM
jgi:hypothetical protein